MSLTFIDEKSSLRISYSVQVYLGITRPSPSLSLYVQHEQQEKHCDVHHSSPKLPTDMDRK